MTNGILIFYVLVTLSLMLYFFTGVFLLNKGITHKQKNLIQLGFVALLTVFIYIFMVFINHWVVVNIINACVLTLMVLFIKNTFLIKKKRTFILIFSIISLFNLILIVNSYFYVYGEDLNLFLIRCIDKIFMNLQFLIIFLWYSYKSHKAIHYLDGKNVEPWIIGRMKVNMYSAFLMAFMSVPDILRINPDIEFADPNNPISMFVFYSQFSILIVFCTCQYLSWIMPKKFKEFLDRRYKIPDDLIDSMKIDEEHIQNQLRGISDE